MLPFIKQHRCFDELRQYVSNCTEINGRVGYDLTFLGNEPSVTHYDTNICCLSSH